MQLKLFTITNNTSCRKAMKWLDENSISYEQKNLAETPITALEIQDILALTNEGTDDILSSQSKVMKKLKVDIDALSLLQLYELISKNPGVLHLPIIHDERRLQVGYSEEEIRQFLPRWFRKNELKRIFTPFEI